MGALTWDEVGTREYEVGVSKCVLFVKDNNGDYSNGVAWSGITAITETPEGAEANDIYADNIKYGSIRSNETFGGTIEAYTYPDEWGECDGLSSPSEGVEVGGQTRKQFGLSYRTEIGSDTNQEAGYKLHLVWGATASPSERSYESINDSPDAITFSWEFDTSPVVTAGYKPISHIAIDSTEVDEDGLLALKALEVVLYGNDGIDSMFPTPEEVLLMFGGSGVVHTIITNASNAEAWAVGTRDGEPVEEGDPTYHNSSKYHAEQSASYYQDAGYDVDFDSDEEKVYLLNQNGERTGEGAALDLSSYAKIDGYYENLGAGTADQLASTIKTIDQEPYTLRTSGGSADIGNRSDNEAIIGVSLPWNQLAKAIATGNWVSRNASTGTVSFSDNVVTVTPSANYAGIRQNGLMSVVAGHKYWSSFEVLSTVVGDEYQLYIDGSGVNKPVNTVSTVNAWTKASSIVACTTSGSYNFDIRLIGTAVVSESGTFDIKNVQFIDLTQLFGTEIADYVYNLEQSNAGDGVAWFRHYFPNPYYAYNPGNSLLHVRGLQSHKITGFNQWDEEWLGGYWGTNGSFYTESHQICTKNIIKTTPNTKYWLGVPTSTSNALDYCEYDAAGNFLRRITTGAYTVAAKGIEITTSSDCYGINVNFKSAYGSAYNHDVNINLSWSGYRNGEYEQHKEHSYPLDSSVVLRGIPKKDANGKLVYDGDRYLPNGTVDGRYGIVDLGTLDWSKGTNPSYNPRFFTSLSGVKAPAATNILAQAICAKYVLTTDTNLSSLELSLDKMFAIAPNGTLYIADTAYIDVATFKTAMSGVYLVYELETPIIDEADPYQLTQIVDDFGTEEYVMTDQNGVKIPVGHITAYQQNLRDKVQHQPDLADSDGTYAIKQIGSQLSLVPMLTPTELPPAPSNDGTYDLRVTVSDGTATYSWANA